MLNYSYHIIILVFLQTLYTSTRGATVKLGWKDNVSPRSAVGDMEKSGKYSANLITKLRRREACHANCYEALGIFCAAVVAGNSSGLSADYMSLMATLFFTFRCVYIYAYLTFDTIPKSYIRSAFYWMGNFCYLTTFWKAGNALNAKL